MKVFLLGGSGFTGGRIARRLMDDGHQVKAFVRPTSDSKLVPKGAEIVTGGIEEADTLENAMRGVDALVCVLSTGLGTTPSIIHSAQKAGVKRTLFFSTTGLFTTLNAPTKVVRQSAEDAIQGSGLDWTILRPTMIYGGKRDRNMSRLIRYLKRYPVFPVFGKGMALQQPVFVDDLAIAVTQALKSPVTVRRAYNVPGAAALTFNEVIDVAAEKLGRTISRFHLPSAPFILMLKTLEHLKLALPIKAEQLERINEDKAFDYASAARDFSYTPIGFADGIEREIRELSENSS